MPTRLFLIGLLAWLLLPTAMIGGFYAYTRAGNAVPQNAVPQTGGRLACSVNRDLAFTGDALTYAITFDGRALTPGQAPARPVDLVLVVDTSPSIGAALPLLTNAVQAAAQSLAQSVSSRFAVISFATQGKLEANWTRSLTELASALSTLTRGDGTDIDPVFPIVEQLRQQGEPGARTILVFFTDGEFGISPAAAQAAQTLRAAGGDIYFVGVPGLALPQTLLTLAGQPDHVLDSASAGDLGLQFAQLRNQIVDADGIGFNAQISQFLDSRNFPLPAAAATWGRNADGRFTLFAGTLAPTVQTFSHPLIAETIGLWRVGYAPAVLSFVDTEQKPARLDCPQRPLLLVLSPWLLALLYGPALLWLLAYLATLAKAPERPATYDHLEVPPLPAPIPLPPPSVPRHVPAVPIPTLVIALGGAGAAAIPHMVEQVARLSGGLPETAHSWLVLDLDARTTSAMPASAGHIAPALAELETLLTAPGPWPAHLAWFPTERYRDANRAQLSVMRGSGGDRLLGRLAFCRWAERGDLAGTLQTAVSDLMGRASPDGVRQVILVAGETGGFGSAAILDTARLVRRIACGVSGTMPPELLALLIRDESTHDDGALANREALRRELETAQLTGALGGPWPRFTDRNDPLLDAPDTHPPFNWLFAVTGPDAAAAIAHSGHLAAVLMDRRPRWQMLSHLARHETLLPWPVAITTIQVREDLVRGWLAAELFLRVVGKDGLVELEPAPGGGYRPVEPAASRVTDLLRQWASDDAGPFPWRDLLARAADAPRPEPSDQGMTTLQPDRTDQGAWMRRTLAAEVTRRLVGGPSGNGWQRGLPAAAAPAVLRHLANRLDAQATDPDTECRALIAADARAMADNLDLWLREIAAATACAAASRAALAAKLAAPTPPGLVTLDALPADTNELVRAALTSWVPGYRDVISALRERLHFAVVWNRDQPRIMLRCYIGLLRDYANPKVGCQELLRLLTDAAALTAAEPGERLRQRLAAGDKGLADALVQDLRSPRYSLLVLPVTLPNGSATDAVQFAQFAAAVRDPLGYGGRHDIAGDERATVRRVAISDPDSGPPTVTGPLPLTSSAEVEAERMRARLRGRFKRTIPPLPPALRLALADGPGFAAFARAYNRGAIIPVTDTSGRVQWGVAGTATPLTGGARSDLATAALAFVRLPDDQRPDAQRPGDQQDTPPGAGEPPVMAALDAWLNGSGAKWNDAAVQATVVLVEGDRA